MKELPKSERPALLRTSFSDDAAWSAVCDWSERENADGFRAYLDLVSDRAFEGLNAESTRSLGRGGYGFSFIFLADEITFSGPDLLILVVSLDPEEPPSFRIPARSLWAAENNLSLANVDFDEFVSGADKDGIYRVEGE